MSSLRDDRPPQARENTLPLPLLAALLLLPAVQTAVSVYWQWHTAITYPLLKAVMIAIPMVIWLRWRRRGVNIRQRAGWRRTNCLPGLCVGAAMAAVILGGYYAVLRSLIDPAPVAAKIRSLGVLEHYWLMAIVISLWNSLLEEYYWRAFLVGELAGRWRAAAVICVAGGLFGLHHFFALLSAFDWPLVALGVAGTMLAGAVWTWMRVSGRSIVDCYVSHVLADLAVMWIGYDMITRPAA